MKTKNPRPRHNEARSLGLDRQITRRDFVGATLIGSGAILLGAPAPAFSQGLPTSWNGYAGIGDYSRSNGNIASVVNAAHGIRDGIYEARIDSAPQVDELYDLIIVGGGFAGLIAAYEFHKARPNSRCLVLDNHPVFGGEAKQNQMLVDGVMLTGPQGSNDAVIPRPDNNYAHVADTMSAVVGLRPEHRWLVTLPLFHANAQYYCIAPAIAVGASVALTSTFSASQWLRQARDLSATHASLFAAPIRMILARRPADAPAVRLEHVWFAQNLGARHYDEFAALAGCRPRQLYGMTETVAIVCADVCDPYRNDTIGPPIEGRPVVLRNPETGADAPLGEEAQPGEPAELVLGGVPGADIFLEYLDDPAATGRSLVQRDGTTWFHTGDMVARVAGNGALRFVGRRDDVIKVSGENVSLTEVEATLAQAPGVLECAVLGRPDPVRDMVPVAYVVPRDREHPPAVSDLAEWSERNLAAAARPRDWHLIEALPRTSVGKVRRFKL